MADFDYPPPKPFEPGCKPAEAWKRWRIRWRWYENAVGLKELPTMKQQSVLFLSIGDDGLRAYRQVESEIEEDEMDRTSEIILRKLDEYYAQFRNEVMCGFDFFRCKRKSGQSLMEFIGELKRLAWDCDYGLMTDRIVRDKLVSSIDDTDLWETLVWKEDLTLDEAIRICHNKERYKVVFQLQEVDKEVFLEEDEEDFDSQLLEDDFEEEEENRSKKTMIDNCYYCAGNHEKFRCPAFGKPCAACGKMNHFSTVCKSRPKTDLRDYD